MYLKRLAVLIKLFPRASRLPFLIGSLIPAGLGSTLAYVETGELKLLRLGLVLLGMAFVHLSVNMFNDYFDARYGVDTAHPPRPLSGGSQVLQEGLESEQEILWQAVLLGALAVMVGTVLAFKAGAGVLLFAVPGALLGYFYSARPLVLSWRGLGELATGLSFGPLTVCGAYFVQIERLSPAAALLSLAPGALITALLFANQYPDYSQDHLAGKKTLVVRFGPRRALPFLFLLLAAGFIPLAAGLKAYPFSPLPSLIAAVAGFAPAAAAVYMLIAQKEPGAENKPGKLMLITYALTQSILLAGGIFML